MLGELLSSGRIEGVDGLPSKLNAAKTNGIRDVIVPECMKSQIENLIKHERMGCVFIMLTICLRQSIFYSIKIIYLFLLKIILFLKIYSKIKEK